MSFPIWAVLALGCANTGNQAVPGQLPAIGATIATVNGQAITQGTVDAILAQFPPGKLEAFQANGGMEQIKEQLILTEALYQEAVKGNVHTKPDVKMALNMAQREVMASAWVKEMAETRVTEEKMKAWYDEHLVQFRKSDANLSMMLLSDEATATKLKAELKGGASFSELAKTNSLDPRTKANGGDMGTIDTRQLPEDLRTAVEAAKAGDVVGPLSLMGVSTPG